MVFKIIIVTMLFIVLYSLGSALFYLVRDKKQSDKVIKSLTWRIGLSLFIFILLMIGQAVGLITPHGLY